MIQNPENAPRTERPLARLTKSRYVQGIQCHKNLFLQVHDPTLADPTPSSTQLAFDFGRKVGRFAHTYFSGGTLIEEDYLHTEEALESTRRTIENGCKLIYEGAFVHDDILIRTDILKRESNGSWKLIEVKASTEIKEHYRHDLAIQVHVLEGAGLTISSASILYLNSNCTHPNMKNIFRISNETESIKMHRGRVKAELEAQRRMLAATTPPEIDIGPHCSNPHECSFKGHCWQHIPKHSVFELYRLEGERKFEFYRHGLIELRQLSGQGERFTDIQLLQIRSVISGRPEINRRGLRLLLGKLSYPIYFLDFETLGLPIPQHKGLRPYEQFPFQYSCHILQKDGQLEHKEFLWTENTDPRPALAASLAEHLGSSGSIIAHNASFEMGIIRGLAAAHPKCRRTLEIALRRFWDLKETFPKYVYHPDFHGSMSLKKVLPALVPEMTYEGMEVADGSDAQSAYVKIINPDTPREERDALIKNLLTYCAQDTLAMVKILERLNAISETENPAHH